MTEIWVSAGTKGGSGKSTVATNFAVLSAAEGKKTLLVDADEQRSSYLFSEGRAEDHPQAPAYTCICLTGKAVRSEILKLAGDYDRIIIDAGGRDTTSQRAAFTVARLALIPCAPSQFDVQTLDTVNDLVEEMSQVNPDLVACAFLNMARSPGKGTENADAIGMIGRRTALTYVDHSIRRFQAFVHAAAQGLAVTELKRPQRSEDAADEIMGLYRYCSDITVIPQEVDHGSSR